MLDTQITIKGTSRYTEITMWPGLGLPLSRVKCESSYLEIFEFTEMLILKRSNNLKEFSAEKVTEKLKRNEKSPESCYRNANGCYTPMNDKSDKLLDINFPSQLYLPIHYSCRHTNHNQRHLPIRWNHNVTRPRVTFVQSEVWTTCRPWVTIVPSETWC